MWARVEDGQVVEVQATPPGSLLVTVDEPVFEWVDEETTETYQEPAEVPYREERTVHVPVPNPADDGATQVLEERTVMVDSVRVEYRDVERTVTRPVHRETGRQTVTTWRTGTDTLDPDELAGHGWYPVDDGGVQIDPALQRLDGEPTHRFDRSAKRVVVDYPVVDIPLDELRDAASARVRADADAKLAETADVVQAALETGQEVPADVANARLAIRTQRDAALAEIAKRKRAEFASTAG